LVLSVPLLWLPLTALVPVHAPDAVHAVAFAELQIKVDEPPTATDVGLADSETVGAGGGGIGLGDGFVPGEANAVVVDTLSSQPARTIPIPTISEANVKVRKYDATILNICHPFTILNSDSIISLRCCIKD